MTKTRQILENMVSSLQILNLEEKSVASLGLNPTFLWAKFVLTDDKPNGNNERIPKEEFPNLIRSGLYTPIKMRAGEISEKHEDATPIGVVTHLKEQQKGDTNQIIGLAALWTEERPEDINTLAERYKDKKPLDVSWEISFREYTETEAGIKDISGAILTGTSLVTVPAYGGRTFIERLFASQTDTTSDINSETEDDELDTLEALKELTASLQDKNDTLASENESLKEQLGGREKELEGLKETQLTDEINQELEDLRAYKRDVEAALEEESKRQAVRKVFSEAGLEVADEYFEKNEKLLLKMDEDELDLFVNTLKSAQEPNDGKNQSESSMQIPRLAGAVSDEFENLSAKDVGKLLYKNRYNKKED